MLSTNKRQAHQVHAEEPQAGREYLFVVLCLVLVSMLVYSVVSVNSCLHINVISISCSVVVSSSCIVMIVSSIDIIIISIRITSVINILY